MSIKKYTDFGSSDDNVLFNNENNKNVVPIKEEVLLTPKNNTSNAGVEILEEKIIKFNGGHISDIMETIKSKYSDTDYFIRRKDDQLHIVKYNEKLNLNVNEFVNTLLKFYSNKPELRKITEGIKVKGNNNFTIVENMNLKLSDKFVTDLTGLLAKKSNS